MENKFKNVSESAQRFVVYLSMIGPEEISEKYQNSPLAYVNLVYSSRNGKRDPTHYITIDLSSLIENGWSDDMCFETPQSPRHEKIIFIESPVGLEKSEYIRSLGNSIYFAFPDDWKDYISEDHHYSQSLKKFFTDNGYDM